MAKREKVQKIDDQWQALQPRWGRKDYEGERKMLYDQLEEGESIEFLLECGWGVRSGGDVVMTHPRGVVAATGQRVLLLNKGRISKNVVSIPYMGIDNVEQPEPEKVTISERSFHWFLDVQLAAYELAEFVRGRMVRDTESLEAALSGALEAGERVERWASCTAGQVKVVHYPSSGGMGSSNDESWLASTSPSIMDPAAFRPGHQGNYIRDVLAVSTDRRILLRDTDSERVTSWAHGTILMANYSGGRHLTCVDRDGEVWELDFRDATEAASFAGLMREHQAAAAASVDKGARIYAEWKLQQPIWDFRKEHDRERRKLREVMEDDEHIECLIWGTYEAPQPDGGGHGGAIVATGRRILFVSDGLLDKHVGWVPYKGIAGLAFDGELAITSLPEYDTYRVFSLDDTSPHNSSEKGHASTFATRLQSLSGATHRRPTQ